VARHTASSVYRERVYENPGFPELVALLGDEALVLDVGCGVGGNLELLQRSGRRGVGLTLSREEARLCRDKGLNVVVADASASLPFAPHAFDGAILSHFLEHVPWPEAVLKQVAGVIRPGGMLYVAVPNPLYLTQRIAFLRGRFRYTETGLMDRTHLRFFDLESLVALVESAGLKVVRRLAIGPVPQGPLRRALPGLAARIDRLGSGALPGLFGFHLIAVGKV
jgi:SAM-dependent methyltransferase